MNTENLYSAFMCLLNEVRRVFFKSGYIENWLILVDAEKFETNKLRFKIIRNLLNSLQKNFCCSTHKILVLNPTFALRILFGYYQSSCFPLVFYWLLSRHPEQVQLGGHRVAWNPTNKNTEEHDSRITAPCQIWRHP